MRKKAARCPKCELQFHQATNYTNTETYCFFCDHPGHSKKECKKLQKRLSEFIFNINESENPITFLVNCGATYHVVKHNDILSTYTKYKKKIPVNLANQNSNSYPIEEGTLSLLLTFRKCSHIINLKQCTFIYIRIF